MDTRSNAPSPFDVTNRQSMSYFLSQGLSAQYKVPSGEDAIIQTAKYIKTYLLELHFGDQQEVLRRLAPHFSRSRALDDPSVLHLWSENGLSFFADVIDSRFVLLHTITEARLADVAFDRMTDGSIEGVDRAWMAPPFLRGIWRGVMTGWKYFAQEHVEGVVGREDVSDPPAATPTDSLPSGRPLAANFRLELSGQRRADLDLAMLDAADVLVGRKSLDQVSYQVGAPDQGHANLSVYSSGKMVGHGTSLELHLAEVTKARDSYGKLVQEIESKYSIGWQSRVGR